MNHRSDHDFYIGYQPEAPPRLASALRWRVAAVLGPALFAVLLAAWNQASPAPSVYEYGTSLRMRGRLHEHPFPHLVTVDGASVRTWLLGAEYKHGADALVAGLDGQEVEFTASRIHRGEYGMLELHDPARVITGHTPHLQRELMGPRTITGEIVDSKCWMGAMNPGEGPTHRLCALRCLRGGLPPMISGVDPEGQPVAALLTGPGGVRMDSVLWSFTAARVRVTGPVHRIGTLLLLETDPASIERVDR